MSLWTMVTCNKSGPMSAMLPTQNTLVKYVFYEVIRDNLTLEYVTTKNS